jgi:UDP-glucose 4-epimerase
MKILITGGLGFIGSNLIRKANVAGYSDITVLDNELIGREKHIEGFSANLVKASLSDDAKVDELVSDHDVIVHLAADTTVIGSIENPQYNFDTNVISTFSLLEKMRIHGKKRLLFASTGGAITGEAEPPLDENMPARPLSPYGASKLAGEGYLSAYSGSFGLQTCAFRFSNVFGPGSFHKGSVVAAYFKSILNGKPLLVYGDGEQTRDFIYVDDICDLLVKSFDTEYSGVYQLGSGTPTSVNELINKIESVVGSENMPEVAFKPKRAGEVEKTYCDISKARAEIGYDPQVSLENGLETTWEWFLSHREIFEKAA